jgi:hypothetical protein
VVLLVEKRNGGGRESGSDDAWKVYKDVKPTRLITQQVSVLKCRFDL